MSVEDQSKLNFMSPSVSSSCPHYHSDSSPSSKLFWNALAGGFNIFVLVARRKVAGPSLFLPRGTGGGPRPAPTPALPSLDIRGTCNKQMEV